MELLSAVVFLNLSESDSWFEAAHFPCYPTASPPLWSRLSLSSLCFGHNRNWLLKTTLSNFSVHLWTSLLLILRDGKQFLQGLCIKTCQGEQWGQLWHRVVAKT